MPTLSIHVGAVLHETPVARRSLSTPAVECQSVVGAPRRRAAPGSQWVSVAAGAATPGHRMSARSGPALRPGRARPSLFESKLRPLPVQIGRRPPRPCAEAQRLPSPCATKASAQAPTPGTLRLRNATQPGSNLRLPPSTMAACAANTLRFSGRNLTLPSSGRSKGRFAPFGPPLMSNVRSLERARNGMPTLSHSRRRRAPRNTCRSSQSLNACS